ncbi:gypsy type transposase [Tanacetum coccineum]
METERESRELFLSNIIDDVKNLLGGYRFKLFVPKETCSIDFSLSGVGCTGRDEPYSNDAIYLMKRKIMQRDAENPEDEQFDGGIELDNMRDTCNTCGDSSYGNLLDEEGDECDNLAVFFISAFDLVNYLFSDFSFKNSSSNGDEKEYESLDSVCLADEDSNFDDSIYTTKFLNGLRMSAELCNGIRLQVLRLGNNIIKAKIISGGSVGKICAIPRMVISPTDTKMPFKLNRRQFPIQVCFAMTINKSQGQTLLQNRKQGFLALFSDQGLGNWYTLVVLGTREVGLASGRVCWTCLCEHSITSIKCVLTQEHFDAICAKYFVSKEVHPQLPSSDATMHERPTGKVGMYTRFFDYANYRIPFSTFFVSVLTHFRIPFSQLYVFGSAKVSHFEILCRVCNINPSVGLFRYFYTHNYKNGWFGFTKRPNVRACYSKNLDSVENWNDHFFWVDEFLVPANARFGWFSGTNIVNEYENGEDMDLNAFIRTADPRKVRIVERARAENERPIRTVAKHHTVTLLPTSVVRPSGELSASIEREFVGDAGGSGGGDQEIASVGGHDNVEPIVPTTDNVVAETEAPGPRRSKKKRVTRESESIPAASHPPKRLRADYGTTGGSAAGGKSPSVLNRLLQDSLLTVEQGVLALPTLPFITSSVTASPLEEGGDHTDSVTGPSLRTVGPSARFVVLSDSSHHSGAKSADPEVDPCQDKDVMTPSVFACSSSSDKTDRTLSLFTGKSGSEFVAGSIRAGGDADVDLQEIYIPEWSVTKGFELNDGRSCANMIDHFTPPAFFKTVRGMEHEQLFAEFNVSAARNLSLSSEVIMRAEYNILEKRKWKSLAEEKNNLLQVKDKEIEELRSQLLQAKDESMEVARLRTRVSSLEAIEGSLRGEVASAKEHNGLLEQEHSALKLKVTSLESIIAEKDRKLLQEMQSSQTASTCMGR